MLGVKKPSSLLTCHRGDLTTPAMWLHRWLQGLWLAWSIWKPWKHLKCSFGTLPLGLSHPPHTSHFFPCTVWLQENNLTSLTLQVLICKMVLIIMAFLPRCYEPLLYMRNCKVLSVVSCSFHSYF